MVALPPPDPEGESADSDFGEEESPNACPQELMERIYKGFAESNLAEKEAGEILGSYSVAQVEDLTAEQANILLASLRERYVKEVK